MITYIDSENRQNYTVLFDKASTKLGLKPIIEEVRDPVTHEITKNYFKRVYDQNIQAWKTVACEANEIDTATDSILVDDGNGNRIPAQQITSLNEYFQHIRDLAGMAIGTGRTGTDPYFLRLPLDEPFFEINANTRGITVPGELSQIAVKGDKLAEVVFFRIDRYYDAVDLNTRHIYIEWELPDGTKGISRDFLRDTQSEKDKIIFGWAIGEELTKQVGTIKFAVRFVEWFDNTVLDQENRRITLDTATERTQMLYSFSSLPATVSVVDSLNYSLFEDDDEFGEYVSNLTTKNVGTMVLYLEDSDPDSVDETAPEVAEAPVFVRDLTRQFYPEAQEIVDKPNEYRINLVGDQNTNDLELELQVEAYSPDGGQISYVFGHIEHTADEGTGVAATGAQGRVADYKFVAATDVFTDEDNKTEETFNTEKIFFIKDRTGVPIVVNAHDAVLAIEQNPNVEFFERVAYIVVNDPGHYYAIADNRVGGKKANSTYSSTFYVPWAAKPVCENNDKMLEPDGTPKHVVLNKIEYTKVIENIAQVGENPPSNISFETSAPQNTDGAVLNPLFSAGTENNLSYTWYRHPDNHIVMDENFDIHALDRPDGKTDSEWRVEEDQAIANNNWVAIEGANRPTYKATQPGCYAVKVRNNFNNSATEANLFEGGISRVTNMPEVPTIANWDEIRVYPSNANSVTIPDIRIRVTDHDIVRYTWHMITDNNADEDMVAAGYMAESTGVVNLTPVENSEGVFEGSIQFRPLQAGLFYLVLENELNGSIAYVNTAKGYGKIRVNPGI